MEISLNTNNLQDYRKFIAIKKLPVYKFIGSSAWFPDEYANRIGCKVESAESKTYQPFGELFDYQRAITTMALNKRKFAVFADCGLGKTLILLEFIRHIAERELPIDKRILIVSPLMVVRQTMKMATDWYGEFLPLQQIEARHLSSWLTTSDDKRIGITNYEALRDDTPQGNIGCLVLDESSMLKSMYGKWGQTCIRLGKGIDWKLCLTGTPAPNDRIEYGNHAVFLDQFPTLNSFLAKYFINRGQTSERWELKPHALEPFYRSLSHWSIFLTNPATYGWHDNCENIPPINVTIHDIDLTDDQRHAVRHATGKLFVSDVGGIGKRSTLGQIGKGNYDGRVIASHKPEYVVKLAKSFKGESSIIWCLYNQEQDKLASLLPSAANIDGTTPIDERLDLIDEFKAGKRQFLISKPKILGFGLNLQIATRQIFSGLQDSYESYYQAVKRSNRYGSTKPLNVHIPVTEVERPMIETVLRKAKMVQADTEAQERIFKEYM